MKELYVTRALTPAAMEALKRLTDFDANTEPRPATRDELINAFKNYKAVVTRINDNIDESLINSAGENLKLIANYGVGFNNIDIKAAQRKNIFVTNTPDILNDATADLGFCLMFAAARKIVVSDKYARSVDKFEVSPLNLFGYDITGKTLGIIGAGRIGSNFGRKAALGFSMKVIYFNNTHNSKELDEIGATRVNNLDDVLKNSDFISLHVPLTDKTKHLIGAEEFKKMKPTAILINTARGSVVDEKALVYALKNKIIAAAGLDVYEHEPEIDPGLKELDNVVLVPHMGSATYETRDNMGFMVAKNVEAVLKGLTPPNLVRV